jgi:hypothetical protein
MAPLFILLLLVALLRPACPNVVLGGSALSLEFDSSNSLLQITASGRTFLAGVTPSFAITATDCSTAFPAFGAGPVTSQYYSPTVNRTHTTEMFPGGSALVLRWGAVKVGAATLSVEVRVAIRDAAPTESAWSGSVLSPAGCCVQTFSVVDLRTLRWSAAAGDRLFLPTMQGIVTDCAQFIETGDVAVCGAAHPELSGVGLQRSEHPWVPNGGERTMGWMALLAAATDGHSAQALYLGAHDPGGRMKLLPAAASGSHALLRAVHAPDNLIDSAAGNWSLEYPIVMAVVDGSWYEAAQIYKRWVIPNAAWTRGGTLEARVAAGELPQWVVDVPVWTRANMDCGTPSPRDANCTIDHAGLCCANKMIALQKLLSAGGATAPRRGLRQGGGPPRCTAETIGPRSDAVNAECCDESTEDCSSGQPVGCNVGCARVLLPYYDDCRPLLAKLEIAGSLIAGSMVADLTAVAKLCRVELAAAAAPVPSEPSGLVPLGMHWYGWNAEQFDSRYPQYTPRGGIAAQVKYAQAHGIHVMPYTNGRLMDPTLAAWKAENASAHACGCFRPNLVSTPPNTKTGMEGLVPCDTTGKPGYYGEKYGNNDQFMGTAAFAVMDPGSAYWQAKLGRVAEGLVQSMGVDGVYMVLHVLDTVASLDFCHH